MSTSEQLLKAYGHLPELGLHTLANGQAREAARQVDSGVLAGRQCGAPDYADEEIASFIENEQGDKANQLGELLGMPAQDAHCLAQCHHAMQTGSGSFPAGCHPELSEDRHAVYYYVDYDSFPRHYKYALERGELESLVSNSRVWPWPLEQLLDEWLGKPMLDLAFRLKEETFRRAGIKHQRTDDHDQSNIHVLSRFISGGTIGIGWFNNGSCGSHVEYHIDSSWRPDLDRCSLLLNHECGHCNNLRHEFANQNRHKSVMSYSWPNHTYGFLTGDEGILPRDASWDDLIRQYGDEPFPTDEPEPDPDPGYNGVVVIDGRPRKLVVRPAGELVDINGVFTHAGELLGFKLLED